MNDGRDSQARLLHQVALQRVGGTGGFKRVLVAGAGVTRDLSDAVFQLFSDFHRVKRAFGLHLIHPIAADLGELFLQHHLRDERINLFLNLWLVLNGHF